ncbi:hypothetical protein BH24ACT15_BH24ACT15_34010 [soil metagenome]
MILLSSDPLTWADWLAAEPAAAYNAAGPEAADAKPAGPLVGADQAIGGLAIINRWLAQVVAGSVTADPPILQAVLVGLGRIDAAATAARARAIVAAEEAGLAERDGASSASAYIAGQLNMTGAAAAKECRLAADLTDMPDTLAALENGAISRDHATILVATRSRQRADNDHAEAARRAAEKRAAKARHAAAAKAAEAAASRAAREQLLRDAEDLERRIREREAEQAAQRAEDARHAQKDRTTDLLDQAKEGQSPDQIADQARRLRADDADALARAEAAQRSRRSERNWKDDNTGMGHIHVTLPGEDFERYLALLEATTTFDHPDTPMEERRSSEQRRADGFIDAIDAALAAGERSTSHGVKPHLSATVSLDSLTGQIDRPGIAQYGTLLSAESMRRLACDAGLTRAILSATGQVLDIGRATRIWTVAQHRAAELTFGGCAFPVADDQACGRPVGWCDLHHVRYWENGGPTDQANGVLLCRRHHRTVHHSTWTLTYDHETLTVTLTRPKDDGTTTQRAMTFATSTGGTQRQNQGGASGEPERLPL